MQKLWSCKWQNITKTSLVVHDFHNDFPLNNSQNIENGQTVPFCPDVCFCPNALIKFQVKYLEERTLFIVSHIFLAELMLVLLLVCEFTRFQNCHYWLNGIFKCIYNESISHLRHTFVTSINHNCSCILHQKIFITNFPFASVTSFRKDLTAKKLCFPKLWSMGSQNPDQKDG